MLAEESPEFIARCVAYARADKEAETVLFNSECARDKVTTEHLTVFLLNRLLKNM